MRISISLPTPVLAVALGILTLSTTPVARSQPSADQKLKPHLILSSVVMYPEKDGFYRAIVTVSTEDFDPRLSQVSMQVNVPHVKTPAEARDASREPIKVFADQLKVAADNPYHEH